MNCKCCGVEAPTKHVEFHQNIGALIVRYHKEVKGNLCKLCINKYFWKFTLINLTLGWWGVISFLFTPVFILNNLIFYLSALKLRAVSVSTTAGNGGKHRNHSTGKFNASKSSQKVHVTPHSSKSSVHERGRVWSSNSDARSNPPQKSKPSSNSSIEELIEHLGCSYNSEFRRLAAQLLGQRGSTATPAISSLLIAGVDVDATVRTAALNALGLIDPNWIQNPEVQKAFPKLTEEFKHSYCVKKSYSKEVSKAAYKLLQQIGKPAVSSLANLIVEEEDKIEYKVSAIWLLRDMDPAAANAAVPKLIQALSNKASKVRIAAAEALVNFRPVAKVAIPKLIVGLADRDIDVRTAMVGCLVATEPAVPDLLPLLVDKNTHVCESVADALVQIGSRTVPVLSETVSQWCIKPKADSGDVEKCQEITVAALQVLGKIGAEASVSMPTIALALIDSNLGVKCAAAQALGNIDCNWVSNSVVFDTIANLAGAREIVSKLVVGLADLYNVNDIKAMLSCLAQCVIQQPPQPLTEEDLRDTKTANNALPEGGGFHRQFIVEVCKILRQQIATFQNKSKVWQIYTKALSLSNECDRDALTQIISEFDPLVEEQNSNDDSWVIEQTLSFLLEENSQNPQSLEATWLLSERLNQLSLRREVQQQICLQLAQFGDGNLLVTKLLKSSLSLAEISPIINSFFEKHPLQPSTPWKVLLEQFKRDELPQIHQVYAALECYIEASKLAEAVGDYCHAARYLMFLSGREVALRALALSERSEDKGVIVQAHQKVAEVFLLEANYREALFHFQKAGNFKRTHYCYKKLEELAEDIPQSFQPPSKTQQSSSQAELNRHKQKLLRLLYNNREQCKNLVNYERKRSPNKSEIELYEDAIFRLLKDRR